MKMRVATRTQKRFSRQRAVLPIVSERGELAREAPPGVPFCATVLCQKLPVVLDAIYEDFDAGLGPGGIVSIGTLDSLSVESRES